MSFAARLKEKRLKAGLSLQDLADAVGSSKAHIWDLESGHSKNPSADLLLKLSKALGTPVGWLLGQEVEESSPAGVMFRQLQDLDPEDLELIQAVIDQRLKVQRDREQKESQKGEGNENRSDGTG